MKCYPAKLNYEVLTDVAAIAVIQLKRHHLHDTDLKDTYSYFRLTCQFI